MYYISHLIKLNMILINIKQQYKKRRFAISAHIHFMFNLITKRLLEMLNNEFFFYTNLPNLVD